MADRDPIKVKNLDGYGNPPLEWSRARTLLETLEERDALLDLEVDLMQGYLFARPAIGQLQSMPTELIQPSRI